MEPSSASNSESPISFFSEISQWAAALFSTIDTNVEPTEPTLGCASFVGSEEKSHVKNKAAGSLPVEVYYKTLYDTLKASPEHFENMLLETIDLVHNLWHESHVLHGNITPDAIMCDVIDDSPQFFFVDLDPVPGVLGVDPQDPTRSRSGHLAASFPFMAPEVSDNLKPRYRDTLPHRPAYDFTALFWVAVWCVNMVEDVPDTDVDDSGARCRPWKPTWRDEEGYHIGHVKEDILDLYCKAPLSPSPAFERYRPMMERWRDIHARRRTEVVNRRRPPLTWMGSDGFTRIRIYEPIYTQPVERSTIRKAILEG